MIFKKFLIINSERMMNAMEFIFIVHLFLLTFVGCDEIESKFSRDYFTDRNCHQIVAFACWNPYDRVDFSRFLMSHDTSVSYVEIKDGLDMEKILKVNYYKLGIFLDFDCPRSEIIFQQYWDQGLRHNESYWWLIVTRQQTVPKESFADLPLNIATEMTIAIRRYESYEMHDVYNPSIRHGGRLNVTYMGNWSIDDGLNIELTQYKYKRRGNFHGLSINVSIMIDHASPDTDFMTYITTPINRHFDTMHRFNYGLIVQLRDYYNFTMNLKRGTSWGYKVNGSWTGILGDMGKGIVDISATPMNYRADRLDITDYTVQTWMIMLNTIFRHPQKNELSNVFLKPFTIEVWQLIIVVGIINWLLLYITVKIEVHYDWREPVNTLETHPASETALIAAASICQQGLSDGPRIISGRIVFLFLFFWALLLFQFYSASVVGSLLVEKPRFINTAEDLLNSNLEVGAEAIAYNYDFFTTYEDPIVRQIFDKKMAISKKRSKLSFFPAEEGLKKVQRGGFALHIDTATAYKFIEETFEEHEICELAEVHLLPASHTSTCVSKHSPFKKMVTYGLRLIMERGTPKRLDNVWNHRRPKCPESHSTMPVPVVIQEFSPAIFLLLFGIAFSLFIMMTEKLIHRRNEKRSVETFDNENPTEVSNVEI